VVRFRRCARISGSPLCLTTGYRLCEGLAGRSSASPERTIRGRKQTVGDRVVAVIVYSIPAFLSHFAEIPVAWTW
jgi:hypothetical protein